MSLFASGLSSSSSEEEEEDEEQEENTLTQSEHQQQGFYSFGAAEKDRNEVETHLHLLFYTFKLERGANEDERLQKIVNLLRDFPEFASTRFKHEPYSSSATLPVDPYTTSQRQMELYPFTYLLIGGSKLEDLMDIYEMYPEVISLLEKMPDKRQYWSLQTACIHRSDEEDVIRFVAEKSPKRALTSISSSGAHVPLHIALNKYAPLETIRILVEMSPESILQQNELGLDCLQRVMWNQSPAEDAIIQYLADNFPHNIQAYRFVMPSQRMDQTCSTALAKLLPQLHTFTCKPVDWEPDAILSFLQCIQHNSGINDLDLTIACSQLWQETTVTNETPQQLQAESLRIYCTALKDFLVNNTSIDRLKLNANLIVSTANGSGIEVANKIREIHNQTLQAIQEGIHSNPSQMLQQLCLSRFEISNAKSLVQLLYADNNPLRDFVMEQIRIDHNTQWIGNSNGNGNSNNPSSPYPANTEACNLRHIKVDSCSMSVDFLCDMLMHFSRIPKLLTLRLADTNVASSKEEITRVTKALTQVLRGKSRVLNLFLRGIKLDMSVLLPALKQDASNDDGDHSATALRIQLLVFEGMPEEYQELCLDVLECNTTLVNFHITTSNNLAVVHGSEFLSKVAYYTHLNYHGRGQVRHTNGLSIGDFVNLLSEAQQNAFLSQQEIHSVQYGLLRECPVMWCCNNNTVPITGRRDTQEGCATTTGISRAGGSDNRKRKRDQSNDR